MIKTDVKFDEKGTYDKYLCEISRDVDTRSTFKIVDSDDVIDSKNWMNVRIEWVYRFPNNWGVAVEAYQGFKDGEKKPFPPNPYSVTILNFSNIDDKYEIPEEEDWEPELTEKEAKTLMRKIMRRKAPKNED